MRRRFAWMAALACALASWSASADSGRATAATAAAVAEKSSEPKSSEGVVNVNDASEEQLAFLPGIGPAKARAIVEHRHAHPFRKADELTKVKGIGRKTFAHLRPYITVGGQTTLKNEVKLHR